MKKLAVIPFAGFYGSEHDAEIDHALEHMWTDKRTGCHRNEGLELRAFLACKWQGVHEAYAKAYAQALADEYELKIEFESLQSPREYNFETDRIFVHIEDEEVKRILTATPREKLDAVAKEMFTSRSGFHSFYSPNVEDWGDVEEWDHNQLLALLTAHVGPELEELSLMEGWRDNGYIQNWIAENTEGIERLYDIHDYLNRRDERRSVHA